MSYNQFFQNSNYEEDKCNSIITAIVKENWNEEKKGFVKVEFFFGEEGKVQTEWIPVASLYTGNQSGLYFFPEVGSEVLIAFINGNLNEPVVIGSLWNTQSTLEDTMATEKNTMKKLMTKGGHVLEFDEEADKAQITLQTPGKLKLNLADEKKVITITDENKSNEMTIDLENGKIKINADKEIALAIGGTDMVTIDKQNINMKADNIKIEGNQSINAKGQSTEIKGNSINVKSDAAIEVKAGAKLTLEGSAMTEVKGGMVKIN